MADENEYQIVIKLDTNDIENDIDTLVFRHIDVFSWIVQQKVEVTVIDTDDVTVKAIVDDLFDQMIEPIVSISAFRIIQDPGDERWKLVHERHRRNAE